jgi:glycosyltransferase involved in cell wall biosynthesis
VPAEDIEAMVKALVQLIEDDELAESLARTAQREARRRFSTERYNREITGLVAELVERRGRVRV